MTSDEIEKADVLDDDYPEIRLISFLPVRK